MGTLKRIKKYLDYKGISNKKFEQSVGLSNGAFGSQLKNNRTMGVDKIENILSIYNDINPSWLLTGKGNMLIENNVVYDKIEESQATYVKNDCDEIKQELKYAKKTISELKTENKELTKELGRKELLIEQMDQKLFILKNATQE